MHKLYLLVFLTSCPNESSQVPESKLDVSIFNEMELIEGKTFLMGNEKPAGNREIYPEEGPVHKMEVSSFWIDKFEVTNAQFKEIYDATGVCNFCRKTSQ